MFNKNVKLSNENVYFENGVSWSNKTRWFINVKIQWIRFHCDISYKLILDEKVKRSNFGLIAKTLFADRNGFFVCFILLVLLRNRIFVIWTPVIRTFCYLNASLYELILSIHWFENYFMTAVREQQMESGCHQKWYCQWITLLRVLKMKYCEYDTTS